ncbi:T-cell surface protein tactile isoform X2 [Choloepus didactylus]|uniref:T-cell surface protein tactile isoform X2 n=1 Tax=Choloepus didactylus TaxID=27675 RepID=UPI0018A0135B|nr:T-cell surface protein tactile isoform X2 [Choloepus didactylus]
MEKKWTYCAIYSIIQIHFIRGLWEETFSAGEDIYALPGSDVNLTCQTQKKGFLVQMQWSKISDTTDLIALYHPQYGFYCANGNPCESLAAFAEAPGNVSKWTLHLRNMSSSLSGKYKCSFTLYPEGIWTKIYNLLIQPNVIQDEWRTNQTIEVEINRTLEIPCFQNISLEISSEFTFAWLVEDNGTQKTLIAQDQSIRNSTWFKDRVMLGTNYGLYLSPIQIHDDDRKFSCHAVFRPGKIWTSSTTVKVFAKPEIPMIVENNSMDVLGERTFTCSLRNVFPTANLTWFIDGGSLQGEKKEIYIVNEERKDKGGFLELKSVLTKIHISEPAQSTNLTIWCMALSPGPGNKVWKISSEKISISLGSVTPPSHPSPNRTDSTHSTQSSPADGISPTRWLASSSIALVEVSTSTPNATPQTNNSIVTTHSFNYPWTSSEKDVKQSVSWMPSETHSSSPSGTVANMPKDGVSWPVIVAALLFLCLVIFGLGVRKWCEYQKEILKWPVASLFWLFWNNLD